jgi:putative flippase GtrA
MRFTVGTSNATAALSGYWLLNRKATLDETYAAILAGTVATKNEFQSGRFVTIDSIPLGNTKK